MSYETNRELNGIRSRNTEKGGEVGGGGERGMEVGWRDGGWERVVQRAR